MCYLLQGVVMLGDTKLMPECVQYMHKRYHLKLQVYMYTVVYLSLPMLFSVFIISLFL